MKICNGKPICIVKKISVFPMLLLFLNVYFFPVFAVSPPEISAKSAILIEEKTGKIIYEKNAYEEMEMASTTKIMSTIISLESGNLDEYFVVDSDAIMVEGSSMGLLEGDLVTKRILAYGMMLPSGNDASNATAVAVSGSVPEFVALMNERAKEIGLEHTNFVSPSGLDDYTDDHFSTSYDMAMLTREALKNPIFREIAATKNVKLEFGNPPYARWLESTNKLLKNVNGVIGVKTGFTDKAKRCLVSACERNGVTLIAVTLNAPDDWNDHEKLYDYGFSSTILVEIPIDNKVYYANIVGGEIDSLAIEMRPVEDYFYYVGDKNDVVTKVVMDSFYYAPILKGQELGFVGYYDENELLYAVPLVATENISEEIYVKQDNLLDKINDFLQKIF